MTVYAYLRVSTDQQARDGYGLDIQQRQVEGYVHMQGLVLDELVVEDGVSGSIPVVDRPKGSAMFARLKAGDIVIAPKLDRLFRSALDALTVVEDLKKRSVALHLLDLGGDINRNGLGKLFLTIAAAFAEAERDRIRERVAASKAQAKVDGRYRGGTRPFGYTIVEFDDETKVLEPDELEQAAIVRMRELKASGASLRAIADTMRASGFNLAHTGVAKILRATP